MTTNVNNVAKLLSDRVGLSRKENQNMATPEYTRRYFLERTGEAEVEVTEAEFVAAERANGFNAGYGDDPDKPVTGGFGNARIRGRTLTDYHTEETTTP